MWDEGDACRVVDVIIKQKVILFPNQTLINDTSHPSISYSRFSSIYGLSLSGLKHVKNVLRLHGLRVGAANDSFSMTLGRFVKIWFLESIPDDFTRLDSAASSSASEKINKNKKERKKGYLTRENNK